jgi:hypothetical protein
VFGASKRLLEGGVIGCQGVDKLLDIADYQVALWWWAGCWYNNGWPGYPPQLVLLLVEKDTMPYFAL